jgi:uncharacterized protein (TIGR02246 family)
MKSFLVVAIAALTLFNLRTSVAGNEEELRTAISAYVEAFNNKDIEALSKMWAEKAVHSDLEMNSTTEGRSSIVADLKMVFESDPTARISGTIESIKLLTTEVAIVSGTVIFSDLANAPSVSHFTAVLQKHDGVWQIESMEETPQRAPNSARAALSQLSWLVGSWEDKGSQPSTKTRVAWSQNESFLLRTTETKEGDAREQKSTQIIGWDPRIKQIRSWTFHTDGSFGEGIWSAQDSLWQISATQVLANGSQTTGTYVIKRLDDDQFTVQLLGREINGELQPSTEPITVSRIPASAESETKPTP